ncbi:MAG TPA: tRNA pseudouridine synthase A [Thermoplasmata archaeon]|nr:tRNA pseudouridine synthase A [Thermoplasmata archaeon]
MEGECLTALRRARILTGPKESFFRSASRTDRGVSAIGNVIAFDTPRGPGAVVGGFNDRARDVWAWAAAEVPPNFHPRHALERWYRYHLYDPQDLDLLRAAGKLFEGEHDMDSFTSDSSGMPHRIRSVEVYPVNGGQTIDVRAPSFRRGMVRRMVAAMVAVARGDTTMDELRDALTGARCDFGSSPPEPLTLMDVAYGFPFLTFLKPKVIAEWRKAKVGADLRVRFLEGFARASGLESPHEREP